MNDEDSMITLLIILKEMDVPSDHVLCCESHLTWSIGVHNTLL